MIFWIFLTASTLLFLGFAAKIIVSRKPAEPTCSKPRCCHANLEPEFEQPNVFRVPKDY